MQRASRRVAALHPARAPGRTGAFAFRRPGFANDVGDRRSIDPAVSRRPPRRRNALVLAVAQALAGGNNTVIVATGGIVGAVLAPDKGLATLPISVMVLGMWFGTLPLGLLARSFGRRFALADRLAVRRAGRPDFLRRGAAGLASRCSCSARSAAGFYAAAHQSYRFAAADTASDAFRPKAISWVLAGGVFAGDHRVRSSSSSPRTCWRRISLPRPISASRCWPRSLAAVRARSSSKLPPPPRGNACSSRPAAVRDRARSRASSSRSPAASRATR